ncbi:MAG: endopeptidase La [Synergistaceae bacterium]
MTIFPLVTLKDIVIFPGVVAPIYISKSYLVKAIDYAYTKDKGIFVTEQIQNKSKMPTINDVYPMGTICKVIQTLYLPDGTLKVIIEGLSRAKCIELIDGDIFSEVEVEKTPSILPQLNTQIEALKRKTLDEFRTYVTLESKIPSDIIKSVENISDLEIFTDALASHVLIKTSQKHILLSELNVLERLRRLLVMLMNENELLKLEDEIARKVRTELDNGQKQYYLREQLKVIHNELGEDDTHSEIESLIKKASDLNVNDQQKEKIIKEITRYSKIPPISPEATVLRGYIDNVLEFPWGVYSDDNTDIKKAEEELNKEHDGLFEVKERILEYLAVHQLAKGAMRSNVICFIGPPEVGKTSLAKSIAKAISRKFVNISLGGMRDEAEIRGHRKTYVGAMPGRIVQKLKQCETSNPVFLLDEIDKLASDFKGDPSSALLEVLDPEQNYMFTDNYMEIPCDLSKVIFITTANDVTAIPKPLFDRMEIITLPGYMPEEKFRIAKNHLIPRLLIEHGLSETPISISDKAIRLIIDLYTREPGVRSLDRQLAKLLRKIAVKITRDNRENNLKSYIISIKMIRKILGVPKIYNTVIPKQNTIGISLGLAWTQSGGEVLIIESALMDGTGTVSYTGNLGNVMKESVQTAVAYLRSKSHQYNLDDIDWTKIDIHIHVPEGAVPKDGPSAGVTIALSLYSTLSNTPISCDFAMTGEMTLHGSVLPIGGLKEKILAAKHNMIRRFILPSANKPDIENLSDWITNGMEFYFVKNISEVFDLALISREENK